MPPSEFDDPGSPTKKRSLVQAEEVVDRGTVITDLPQSYPDDDIDTKSTQYLPSWGDLVSVLALLAIGPAGTVSKGQLSRDQPEEKTTED